MIRRPRVACVLFLTFLLAACGSEDPEIEHRDEVREPTRKGVPVEETVAERTIAAGGEIQIATAEWRGDEIVAEGFVEESSSVVICSPVAGASRTSLALAPRWDRERSGLERAGDVFRQTFVARGGWKPEPEYRVQCSVVGGGYDSNRIPPFDDREVEGEPPWESAP